MVETLVGKSDIETDALNYAALASKTEGYSAQDLRDLTNRAVYKATVRAANTADSKVRIQSFSFRVSDQGIGATQYA